MPDPANELSAEALSSWAIPPAVSGPGAGRGSPAPGTAGRFRLLGELARGAMGVVYGALDPQFGREVAVKTLHERLGGSSEAVRRFDEESRITGQLQHPGIPAIFESGRLDDGRPFLAMKLVKGRTLAALLDGGGLNRADLIPAFEKVCQALAYAHSRRVIHRDLKPSNVMVGAFGEVQVMDWGLAKVLGERAPPGPPDRELTVIAGTVIRDPRADSDGSETQAGSMLGTPAFMSPEQAAGAIGLIDERADVFGLGAILCSILTGKPPYIGHDVEAVCFHAVRARLEGCHARLDASGADPEWVALTKRCLAPEAADRPANAGEVASAVAELRRQADERARQAELERARTELRVAEERKRRRVQLALAASVLGFFLFAGAGAWWAREQATERQLMQQVREEREKRVREGVEQVFARLPELYDRALWEQAEAALDQATYILGDDGDADLRERVEAAKRDTAFVRSLDEIRLRKLDSTEGNRPDLGKALSKYAEAFRDNGFDVDSAGRGQIVSRLNTSSVRPYLIAAMDDWALTGAANRQQLFGITAEATGQEWRNRLLDVWNDSARLAKVYDTIPRAERSPAIIANVCYRLGVKDGGIRRLDDGRHQYPGDFWLHVYSCLLDPTNPEKMIGSCRAAMVVRPRAVVVHIIMAFAMQAKGDFDGVIASCKEILLVDPKNAATYSTLGYALRTKRDYDGAIVAYRKAIHLDPKNAITRTNLGFALKCNGERREASAHFKDAIVLDPNYAMAHDNLGYSLLEAADFPGAAVAFREAIRLDPKYKGFQPSFAFVQERLALRDRLAAVKQGRDRPNSPTEAALLANIFGQPSEKDYALAYRLFDEAVASDPSLAERSCYKAAAAAVRFAAGDDPGKKPDAAEQASLRAKAAAWLAADLAAVRRVASSPDADHRRQAAARLRRTRDDADFVAVRDPKRLATLPPEEHKRWDAFWGAVGVELAKIEPAGKSNP